MANYRRYRRPSCPPLSSSSRRSDGWAPAKAQTLNARYVTGFSYSGPTTTVHLERDAKNGKRVYVDRDTAFAELPAALIGADWVQAANGDSLYSAVDLMEIAVKAGSLVFVVHYDRLARPAWLMRLFQSSDMSLTINGRSMRLFHRLADRDESLTLGTNTENVGAAGCNMYVVFVNAAATRQSRSGKRVYPCSTASSSTRRRPRGTGSWTSPMPVTWAEAWHCPTSR